MRLDPDVILVGEIRDTDTARTATQAALTGHLVLSSVHANDTVGVLFRLIDLGVEPYLIATALVGVVAQRMVRRVCPHCRALAPADPEEQMAYEQEMEERRTGFYYGTGCNFCANTGYLGRAGVFEILVISEEIRRLLLTGAGGDSIRAQAVKDGVVPMRRDGMLKVRDGITTPREVLRGIFSVA
jgi:general secretion pathway protein E